MACVVSDYLTQNGAHHASHIAQQCASITQFVHMAQNEAPPPLPLHSMCVGYRRGRGGWRNSEEFTSTHKNKLCVSDQPNPLCIYTTCYVRAPALIMIAHPNGLNGFFSSEVNDGAEPGSQFSGGVTVGFALL